jgi:hypothetical protein
MLYLRVYSRNKSEIKKLNIPKFVATVHFGKHAGYVASYVCFSTTVLYVYKTSVCNPRPVRFFREAYFC